MSLPGRIASLFAAFVRNDRAWLVFFVAMVLALPILLSHTTLSMPSFNDAPRQRLLDERPEIVLIGDSMLRTRIDEKLLSELSGRRISVLEDEGSASAMWYLFVKNYIAALPEPRPRAIVFFRDRYLTDPNFRLDGRYLKELYAVMHGEDPIVGKFLSQPTPGFVGWVHGRTLSLYPATRLHDPMADSLANAAERYTRRILSGGEDIGDILDRTFDIRNLRPDVPSDLASEDIEAVPFDPSPAGSFLPFLVDTAKDHGIDLWFYRVKRRPNDGVHRRQSSDLAAYIADLRAWLSGHGAHLVDETGDERLTIDYYSDGDHVSTQKVDAYTRHFYETHRELFQ